MRKPWPLPSHQLLISNLAIFVPISKNVPSVEQKCHFFKDIVQISVFDRLASSYVCVWRGGIRNSMGHKMYLNGVFFLHVVVM